MRYICLLCLLISATAVFSQKAKLTETSVVKDSSGTVYPSVIWKALLMKGGHSVKAENATDVNSHFFLVRLTDEEKASRFAKMPKPMESKFFKNGEKFSAFKTRDIDGNKLNLKEMQGKILVLNFWFIKCPPCRAEMPELNGLVDSFKSNDKVVFIAVALDAKYDLQEFLQTTPFKYAIVDDGRYIADSYRITSYPTHVVVDGEGKVYFHTSGLALNTVHWIKKSIEELAAKIDKAAASL